MFDIKKVLSTLGSTRQDSSANQKNKTIIIDIQNGNKGVAETSMILQKTPKKLLEEEEKQIYHSQTRESK